MITAEKDRLEQAVPRPAHPDQDTRTAAPGADGGGSGGGRAPGRSAVYMAALVASRHNPVIRSLYQRLRTASKSAKVALIACMHKLLIIIDAMLRDRQPWDTSRAVAR